MAKTLVTNLEREIDRLRRQSETVKLRRSLAAKDTEEAIGRSKRREGELKAELEKEGGSVIHHNDSRFQVIKNRPNNLALENMSYEDVEELKVLLCPLLTIGIA